ncbi:helix-turn-helix transcriptional regulator [Zymobacter palmae]|uniref:Predicted transcriptional regulator n=1 Tax=Zymobacter palmae TaxID=33074 RepID=A0A348HCI4_9GAMM|nr:YafY family protein [Zymobacter palmae]BBG29336.1 predicted transcriptional regulator [Zymobacter palmae]
MTRAERLLVLIQKLRCYRYPVTAAVLAESLGVSKRTLYRDIAQLQHQGARIEGSAGVGYMLREGFILPPLMFSSDEIEALVLGLQWVAQNADEMLGQAAVDVQAKVRAVLPERMAEVLDLPALKLGPSEHQVTSCHLSALRDAIRHQFVVELAYHDQQGRSSSRRIWPMAIAFFDASRVLVAWCELRQDFRHFRTDRIDSLCVHEERYPRHRQTLLHTWKAQMGITD